VIKVLKGQTDVGQNTERESRIKQVHHSGEHRHKRNGCQKSSLARVKEISSITKASSIRISFVWQVMTCEHLEDALHRFLHSVGQD